MISKRMMDFDHWTKYLLSVGDLSVQVTFRCHMRRRIWVWMMVMISCNPVDSSFEVVCAKTVFSKYLDMKTRCAKLFINQFISVPAENYYLRLIARYQQRVGDMCFTFKLWPVISNKGFDGLYPFERISNIRREDSVETYLFDTILTTKLGQLIDHLRVYQKKSLSYFNDREFYLKTLWDRQWPYGNDSFNRLEDDQVIWRKCNQNVVHVYCKRKLSLTACSFLIMPAFLQLQTCFGHAETAFREPLVS